MRLVLCALFLLSMGGNPVRAEDTAASPVNTSSSAAPLPLRGLQGPQRFSDKHPRLYACTFPLRHPRLALRKAVFPVAHPLQFGKCCETSGANGLLGFVGGCAQVGTTTLLGARKF